MEWFKANAPIRLKLLIAFGLFVGFMVAVTAVDAVLPWALSLEIDAGLTLLALVCAWWLREAIAVPYVTTVVRMEALAAGDLKSPIRYTEFTDCVGRLTRAMASFKQAAEEQIELNAVAHEHAAVVRGMGVYFQRLADGDLSAKISEQYPEEFSGLKDGYNGAIDRLRDLIDALMDSTQSIETGSREITQASGNLARRTEQASAELSNTAVAVKQITGSVRETAVAADQSLAASHSARSAVIEGRNRTTAATVAMDAVTESSAAIDGVIEGLEKIAFQTRVLAMNAAVEAGRAGEAGRGFAVVADLVSALALRAETESASAKEQLTRARDEIGTAVAAVGLIDEAFQTIETSTEDSARRADEIARASREQADATKAVSSALSSIESGIQQNAAMVEETSAATTHLLREVEVLSGQTGAFKLERGAAKRGAAMLQAA
ncbi:methyl-accepting chemotaxis protein [Sphingomonas sp. NFR04]|uniref:methyl-accepting chemotaxis protein n=1 Tax=Sphingomonas sp. NFR04 TaxID=1566283 RepID=UPI0008E865C9|nr:methyl-accepting chemotaxis protein [Sphingomonas sp. NFR04]SFJ20674.1 methyl-accepting chemotaxis protein [Sphingomonas sp. NFR04]